MGWSEGDVKVDGSRMHYYRRGTGRPVVLAHGATDNGECWTRVAEALEDEFDLIAYDARNHGLSDPAEGMSGGGPDLTGLVEALALQNPGAMGHSMGAGAVAAALAAKPGMFSCGVLEDPGWRSAPVPAGARPSNWMQDLASQTEEQIIENGRKANPTWHHDEFPAWARSKKQFRPWPGMGGPPRFGEWRDTAKAIECPVLLVCGGSRALVDPEASDEAQRLNSNIEVVRFENAGHNIRREAYEGFVDTVRAFLRKNV
jgi:pimeloyl-ACP methyl ester carboxylesterase